jgi:hypothetical protein
MAVDWNMSTNCFSYLNFLRSSSISSYFYFQFFLCPLSSFLIACSSLTLPSIASLATIKNFTSRFRACIVYENQRVNSSFIWMTLLDFLCFCSLNSTLCCCFSMIFFYWLAFKANSIPSLTRLMTRCMFTQSLRSDMYVFLPLSKCQVAWGN